jgi:hypothetical protein
VRRLVKMVFTASIVACLSQDIAFLSKRVKPLPKVELVQTAAKPNKTQNINQLMMNFLLK